MLADIISAAARALSFIALFQAAGAVVFLAIFARHLQSASDSIRRLGRVAAVAGVALVVMHLSLEAARMAGALSGMLDTSLQLLVLDSPMGIAAALRVSGLVTIAAALMRSGSLGRMRLYVSLGGAALTVAGFLFVGHTAVDPDRILLAALLGLHLATVAFWFGALIPLILVTRREQVTVAMRITDGFSRIASWWVPGIFIAGMIMTVFLADAWAVFAQPYGALVLAKVAGFLLLMVLAAMNKWRYAPVLATRSAAIAFRRSVAAEYVLICIVLAATAVLTTFFSPEPS